MFADAYLQRWLLTTLNYEMHFTNANPPLKMFIVNQCMVLQPVVKLSLNSFHMYIVTCYSKTVNYLTNVKIAYNHYDQQPRNI